MKTQTNNKGKETLCDCGHIAVSNGFSTGYGTDKAGKRHCFACCGENDKKELLREHKATTARV